jgi:hypothetical protein
MCGTCPVYLILNDVNSMTYGDTKFDVDNHAAKEALTFL